MFRGLGGFIVWLVICGSCAGRPSGPQPLVLSDVTLVDMVSGEARPGLSVLIAEDRITQVGDAAEVTILRDTRVIDGAGRFLIPGLWDVHVHLGGYEPGVAAGPSFIAHGVTGVRDMGSPPDEIVRLVAESRVATPARPRLMAVGPLHQGPLPFEMPLIRQVASREDAIGAVTELARLGFDFVKVGDSVPPELFEALASEAGRRGLGLVGHIPVGVSATDAVEAGQQTIEHFGSARFHGLLLACSTDEEALTAVVVEILDALGRGDDREAELFEVGLTQRLVRTFSENKARALFRTFARSGTYNVPTLLAVREVWEGQRDGLSEEGRVAADDVWSLYSTMVRLMQEEGVGLLACTDLAPDGALVHDELALLVAAGLTPLQALRAATSTPAAFFGLSSELGSIESGQRANLVLLRRNPLVNIANTKEIDGVVVGGEFLDRAQLEALTGT